MINRQGAALATGNTAMFVVGTQPIPLSLSIRAAGFSKSSAATVLSKFRQAHQMPVKSRICALALLPMLALIFCVLGAQSGILGSASRLTLGTLLGLLRVFLSPFLAFAALVRKPLLIILRIGLSAALFIPLSVAAPPNAVAVLTTALVPVLGITIAVELIEGFVLFAHVAAFCGRIIHVGSSLSAIGHAPGC